ncbi:hypothetical protein TRFO_10435 [Tritrichomonas foetus]|uniref:F5/8 type C domain-containing protein n=1 Tax=Tritrichomonas foetus TaxID=1144522 RepID=A0A1J4J8M7_9EUKA|nr:hypothetical protein TRFO_10435 [Tritrichomonas foetus]|eukprot:OHS95546.1 hypothetical protein TRFO_10435 [Tritrichomonas foetus]
MSDTSFTANFDGQAQFKGIISTIRDRCGGNPCDKDEIEIIAPTETHPEYPLRNLVEFTDLLDKCYWNFACYDPKDDENWLIFDFHENHKVSLNGYTIRSGGSSHPKGWRIEGSNDRENWTLIHEVENCNTLNAPRKTQTFQIEGGEVAPVRYIKYVQTQNQSPKPERKYRINLKAIEFFGQYITCA